MSARMRWPVLSIVWSKRTWPQKVGVGLLHRVRDEGEEQYEGGSVAQERARAGQRAAACAIDWRGSHDCIWFWAFAWVFVHSQPAIRRTREPAKERRSTAPQSYGIRPGSVGWGCNSGTGKVFNNAAARANCSRVKTITSHPLAA